MAIENSESLQFTILGTTFCLFPTYISFKKTVENCKNKSVNLPFLKKKSGYNWYIFVNLVTLKVLINIYKR